MTPVIAAPRPPRTQAQRSATTQGLLLDAALDCLAELGYAGTTTTVVAERAGVSRGAQLHHFPTRAALVAAAVEHLYARLTDDYQAGFARLRPGPHHLRAALELLWAMFTVPRYAAVLELFTAARTDCELHAQLRPIAARHQANVVRLARAYFAEAARDPRRFDATLQLVLDAMQGMAASRAVDGGSDETERLEYLHDIAAQALAAGPR
jgi:AcrR family transcriptional regulator